MKIYSLLLALFLFFVEHAEAKVRILTFHYNKPDFLELQYLTFKKFLVEDFELIVFNDALYDNERDAINEMCAKYNIPCIRYEQEWHFTDPFNNVIVDWLKNTNIYSHLTFRSNTAQGVAYNHSVRHSHVIQYAMDHFGYCHGDTVVIADGDIFPIRPIRMKALLENHEIVGVRRYYAEYDVEYLWVPFIAFDVTKLPNIHDLKFHIDVIKNYLFDTGAATYHYLNNNPNVRVLKFPYVGSSSHSFDTETFLWMCGFNDNEISLIKSLDADQCVEFHIKHHFLHFGASSFGLAGWENKSECVKNFLHKILQQ